ncbi:Cis-zeatin O-glucosyltransferase 2 [Apostasia shenzhenica]|uniref:Glycosyltransferase n=1 Tax=Apostasia shenzhenica TaxID=1088818 RepID=A0A2I0AXB7_9ASPA|nr:Cis-zeatin O-glucosyltransferase 2 [Apostasia shenzhenica]
MGSDQNQEKEVKGAVAVVMVPLPAQGHLNPLLHLSGQISAGGIDVYYVSSAIHNRQARERIHGRDVAGADRLHFLDVPIPCFPSPAPNPNSADKFPSHLQPSFDATADHILPQLPPLLQSLSPSYRRIALVYDSCISSAAAAVSAVANAEPFIFHASSAICNVFFHSQVHNKLYPALAGLTTVSFDGCVSEEFLDFISRQRQITTNANSIRGRLFNTCRAVEGNFVDGLSGVPSWKGERFFVVGPLHPVGAIAGGGRSRHECLRWLDLQPPASVLYVSFGTTSSLPREQMKEIAAGLEAAGERFIWVIREADRCDIFKGVDAGEAEEDDGGELAAGGEFERRVEGRGVVVRGWAPQTEILGHPATGGFVSHCGWNSLMEAMSFGVPILTWPMHSDQPANDVLVTEVARAGMRVREWEERGEVVAAGRIREAVARMMTGEEGREARRRAAELGKKIRSAVMQGGSSKEDLDDFLSYISRPSD